MQSLCTLRVRRRRRPRNTRYQAALPLTWAGLPPAGSHQLALAPTLFDHLVGEGQQCRRNLEAERLGGLKIDDQLEFRGLLDGQVSWAFRL